ncbi:MAG: hypothetical protein ABI216_20330 [Devosia sp.]
MNKLPLVLAVVGLAALPISAYAAGVTATANAATKTMAANAVGASLTDKSTFGDVMGTLSPNTTNAMGTTTDFGSINAKSNVTIVLVSKLKGYTASGMKLSQADVASMSKLDAKVAANAAMTAKLKQAGYLPSDVAAVSIDATGNATVFVAK